MTRHLLPVVDLFAGAGGFGLAVEMAGGQLRGSVELDETCVETLEANRRSGEHRVERADVRNLDGNYLRRIAGLGRSDPLVVVGGPPCQPFSKASYWTDPGDDARYRRARSRGESAPRPSPITRPNADDRRDLLAEFYRLVVQSGAVGFVMENVASLLHPRNRKMFGLLVSAFQEAGYSTTVVRANAEEFGIPQKRRRIFVLGSKAEPPMAPSPTHNGSRDGHLFLEPVPAVGAYIAPFAGEEFFEPEEVVEGRWAEQLREIPPGWNYKHLTEWAGHPEPVFEAETRFWNFLLKLDPDLPSWTINANPGPWVGPFHWESRRLRTPELAAIQTFPGGYRFMGNRRERVRQIGNAVPPRLAAPMVHSVIEAVA